jgi:molybdopterin biosynthesis enzyme
VRQEKKIERKTDRDRGRQRENRKRMLFYYNIVITMGATSMGESDLFVNPSDFS